MYDGGKVTWTYDDGEEQLLVGVTLQIHRLVLVPAPFRDYRLKGVVRVFIQAIDLAHFEIFQ